MGIAHHGGIDGSINPDACCACPPIWGVSLPMMRLGCSPEDLAEATRKAPVRLHWSELKLFVRCTGPLPRPNSGNPRLPWGQAR